MKSRNPAISLFLHRHACGVIGAFTVMVCGAVHAADVYFDVNGTTTGSGATAGAGAVNWNTTTANWAPDADGLSASQVWTNGDSAIFSAGTDGTGTYTLTSGGVTVDNITQQETKLRITTGAITLADTAMTIDTQTRKSGDYDVRIDSVLANSGAGASSVTKSGTGILMLAGASTFSGGFSLNAGSVFVETQNSAFGTGTLTLAGGNLAKSWGGGTITFANPVSVTGTTNVAVVQGNAGNIQFNGALTGSGNLQINNTAVSGFAVQAASVMLAGDLSGFTGTISHTTGNNRLRLGDNPASASLTTVNASSAKVVTSGSTTTGNPIDLADNRYGTVKIGELSGTGGILRAGWTDGTGNNTTFEVGALNTNSTFAGAIQNNVRGTGGLAALTKIGNGTLVLSGASTYTQATTVNGGTLQIGNGTAGSISATSAVTVGASGTLALNLASGGIFSNAISNSGSVNAISDNPMTFAGFLSGGGSLVKSGAGTLTISQDNNGFTGSTTVNSGRLHITGYLDATSGISLGAATLSGKNAVSGVTVNNSAAVISNGDNNTDSFTLDSLAFNTTGTLNLNKANDTSTPALVVSNDLNIGPGFTVSLATAPAWTSGQTYNLISYSTLTGTPGNIVKGTIPGLGARQVATLGTGGGFISLSISGDTPVWSGAQSNAWTTAAVGGAKNWKLLVNNTSTDFVSNDLVIFNDSATGSTSINISDANVAVAGVTFENSSLDYTVSSSGGYVITDGAAPASVSKSGTGTVTLATVNTYTGITTINGGTLKLGDGARNGDIATSSSIANQGTLVFDRAGGSFGYANAITGAGSIVKSGTGTQILSGANSYTGNTTINAGTLQFGNGGTTGSPGAGSIANNGSLVFNRSNAIVQATDVGFISGTGSVSQSGTGSLTLSLANTYQGGTKVNAGTLIVGSNDALGTGALTLAGGTLSSAGGYTLANAVTAQASTTSTINTNGSNLTLNGNISGSGNLNREATGTAASVFLGGDNSGFSGTFTIANNTNAATRFVSATAGSANARWVNNQPTNTRTSVESPGNSIQFGSLTGTGFLTAQGTGITTIEVGNLGLNESYTGVLNELAGGSFLAVRKTGAGNWTLTAISTYTGGTTINGGTLTLAAGGGAGTVRGTITVNTGATLNASAIDSLGYTAGQCVGMIDVVGGTFNNSNASNQGYRTNFSLTGGTVSSTGGGKINLTTGFGITTNAAASSATWSAPIELRDSNNIPVSVDDGAAADDLVISGAISGTGGAVTKTGTGTLKLSGTNTYTGDTTVLDGVLAVGGSAIADANQLIIDGGKVDPSGSSETVDKLFFGAAQQAAGTWGATGSGATHIDDTHFTGSGVVNVTTGPAGYTSWADANAPGQTIDQDHDDDGVENGIEYFMGLSGSAFTANPALVSGTITWPMGATYIGDYGTDYVVQTSSDLVTWTDATEGAGAGFATVTAGVSVSFTLPTGGGKVFARLVVNH